MNREKLDTHQKAFQINMDLARYGTFAEIGAGQEVARAFFRVGGAAGTIAKSISAYDMTFSDAIYGPCERYVSRQRLQTMLDHEYELLLERLNDKRGSRTAFFVFANTVTARSYTRRDEAHGWLGIRFQSQPLRQPSDIIIHVRMLDRENVLQQETLGIVGVNLIHAAFYHREPAEEMIERLRDDLTNERIEIDMIKCSGPDFAHVDNRLLCLELVRLGLANAAMFTAEGEVVQPSEMLHGRPIVVERGSFRPVNLLNLDMLECARRQFEQTAPGGRNPTAVLMEITMRNLLSDTQAHKDFLARVELLSALKLPVLISNFAHFYPLAAYLSRYTKERIGIAIGVPALKEIFDEKYYTDLEGGILESFGRLFKADLKLHVYPFRETDGTLITAQNLQVAPHLRHLYLHLLESGRIVPIETFNEAFLPIHSTEVLSLIKAGEPGWEKMVPPVVAALIRRRHFFGSP